jgi:hypothetical protein
VDDCVGEYDECGECNGDGIDEGACDCAGNVEDCAGECGGSAVADECGVCGGNGSSCAPGVFGLALNDDGNLDVTYSTTTPIFGFQFGVSDISLTGASGGAAGAAGFTVSSSASTVLGFSFSGSFIPAGSGVLTVLSFEGVGEACLSDIVVSGDGGVGLETASGDCVTIEGTCDSGIYDCAGVCDGTAVEDCAGECGGSAAEDCAGECGGTAVEDCAGECGGSAVEDEAGECGGSAEVDECGECGGDGSSCEDASISIDFGVIADGSMEILMTNTMPIAGFQFNITGVDLDGASARPPEAPSKSTPVILN